MVIGFQEMGFLVFDFRRERKGRLWLSLSKTQRMERKQWDRRLTYKAGGGEGERVGVRQRTKLPLFVCLSTKKFSG